MSTDPKNKVCRCLFGKPDHEGLREDLNKELKLQRVSSRSTWNFDFETETPLQGRYQWIVISDSDFTPAFYRSLAQKKVEIKNNKSPKPKDVVPDCQEPEKILKNADSKRRSNTPHKVKLVQARMDVYLKQRKRRRESDVPSVRTPKSLRV